MNTSGELATWLETGLSFNSTLIEFTWDAGTIYDGRREVISNASSGRNMIIGGFMGMSPTDTDTY